MLLLDLDVRASVYIVIYSLAYDCPIIGGIHVQKHRSASRSSSRLQRLQAASADCLRAQLVKWTACADTEAGGGSLFWVRYKQQQCDWASDVGIEGTLTCVASFILFFLISDFPEETSWLNDEEKEFVKARLHEDVGQSRRHDPLTPRRVLEVLKDCK